MRNILISVLVLLSFIMCGCGDDSNKSNNAGNVTKQEEKQTKKFDFPTASKLLKEDILRSEKFVKDIHVEVDEQKSQITMSIIVSPAVNDKYVLELLDTVLRKYNLFCSAGGSSKEKWGNLYDDYSLMIGVATPTTVNNPDKWLVYDAVAQGVQTRHKFKVKVK